MKNFLLIALTVLLWLCGEQQAAGGKASADSSSVNPATDWKFGIALWTFHDVNFPESLNRVDNAGIKYIEPNTFHKAGPELNDTVVGNLSASGIEKLKA